MKTERAQFLIDCINPLLKGTTSYIRKLKLDRDNEQIEMINLFQAVLHRIDYKGRTSLDVLREIVDNAL